MTQLVTVGVTKFVTRSLGLALGQRRLRALALTTIMSAQSSSKSASVSATRVSKSRV